VSESGTAPAVTSLGDGRFLVERDGRQRLAYGVRAAGATWVYLEGEVAVVRQAAASI
jgi:hypothetical protein